ncbi:hypothetical protein P3L10_018465 [Capsicum annuum]
MRTIHGDLYDNIYKQPTLLEPKLGTERNKRTIAKELERQRLKAMQSKKAHKSGVFMIEEFWLNKEGCPFGTVPIRKIAKKQLQSAGDASSSLAYEYFGYKWIDFAGIFIKASPPIDIFFGVSAFLCLYNPQVSGTGSYSASTIFLQNGNEQIFEQIQVG